MNKIPSFEEMEKFILEVCEKGLSSIPYEER